MNLSSSNVDPDSLILVGTYPTVTQAHERGLVVLAMSLPYWIARGTEGFNILVSVDQGDRIAREIALYDAEMEGWNPAVDYEIPNYKSRIIYPYVISILLAFAFLYQMREGPAWIDRWCVDSQAILQEGEWWRTATGLFLHGDLRHLLSNIVSGACFGSLVAGGLGAMRGWLLILLSGILGNWMATFVYSGVPHRSIGASTAVFGALGILVGHSVRYGYYRDRFSRWRSWLVPLGGGLSMLAMLGAGGMNGAENRVDIVAHAGGFVAGILLVRLVQLFPRKDTKD